MAKVHIVFGENFASWVNHLLLNKGEHQDVVINIDEFLSYGPITHMDTEDGLSRRVSWFKNVLTEDSYDKYVTERKHQSLHLSRITKEDDVTIWRGNCVGDYIGTLYVATRLAGTRLYLIDYDVNSKPLSDEVLNVLYGSRFELKMNEHHLLINEWLHWQKSKGLLRRYNEKNEIITEREDFYDTWILDSLNSNTLSKKELLTSVLVNQSENIPKSFYHWRINRLISQNFIVASLEDQMLSMQKGVL